MWIDEEFDKDCDHLHLVLNGLLLSVVTVIWIYLIRVDSGFTPTVWGLTEKHVNLLSIQQEKKRDKGQIAFPLMGGKWRCYPPEMCRCVAQIQVLTEERIWEPELWVRVTLLSNHNCSVTVVLILLMSDVELKSSWYCATCWALFVSS